MYRDISHQRASGFYGPSRFGSGRAGSFFFDLNQKNNYFSLNKHFSKIHNEGVMKISKLQGIGSTRSRPSSDCFLFAANNYSAIKISMFTTRARWQMIVQFFKVNFWEKIKLILSGRREAVIFKWLDEMETLFGKNLRSLKLNLVLEVGTRAKCNIFSWSFYYILAYYLADISFNIIRFFSKELFQYFWMRLLCLFLFFVKFL